VVRGTLTDYVVTEYKYGSSTLGSTKDGRQTSDDWLAGVNTGRDRIQDAVGRESAALVKESMKAGSVEKWLLRVDEAGNVSSQMLDATGKVIKGP
jgi:filamentous hemagglutinin